MKIDSSTIFDLSFQPFSSQDLLSNSPYCLPYNSHDFTLENLVLIELINP